MLLNKLSIDHWMRPNLMLLASFMFNFIISLVIECIVRRTNHSSPRKRLQVLKAKVAIRWVPLTMVFVFNLFTSLKAMQTAGLSTVIVFRNINSLIISVVESQNLDEASRSALFVIVIGSIAYGWGDLNKGIQAYLWTFANMALTISYDLYIRYLSKEWPLDVMGQQFYHCVLSSPVVILMAFANNELNSESAISFYQLSWAGKLILLGSVVAGFFISTSALMLANRITATSFSVLKNSNKILVVIINILWIEGLPSKYVFASLLVTLGGGLWYGLARIKAKEEGKLKGE